MNMFKRMFGGESAPNPEVMKEKRKESFIDAVAENIFNRGMVQESEGDKMEAAKEMARQAVETMSADRLGNMQAMDAAQFNNELPTYVMEAVQPLLDESAETVTMEEENATTEKAA